MVKGIKKPLVYEGLQGWLHHPHLSTGTRELRKYHCHLLVDHIKFCKPNTIASLNDYHKHIAWMLFIINPVDYLPILHSQLNVV